MKKITILASILFSTALISCGGDKEKVESTDVQTETANETNVGEDEKVEEEVAAASTVTNLLQDKSTLQKAEQLLKDLPKFKGKDIKVFQNIHFYEDGRVMVDLQDPDKPENIDNYIFKDGKWGEPQPVQISGDGDISSNVFSLNQIKFETVADIHKQLEEKAKAIEGAKITSHIYYVLNVSNQTGRWYTGVDGTRESYSGYFNADGSLQEFKKK